MLIASPEMQMLSFMLKISLINNIAAGYGQTALGYRLVFTAATLLLVTAVNILFVRER